MIGVTGATGFVGSHLMDCLGDKGFPIDLRNLSDKDIESLLIKKKCRTIVHLASPMPSQKLDKQTDLEKTIEELTSRLVKICQPLGKFYFINISSIRVHSNNCEVFSSKSPTNPIDGYGRGKVASERIFIDSPHRVISIRSSSVQGIGINGKMRGLVSIFAEQGNSDGVLKVMGNGSTKKDLIHVNDLVTLIINLSLNKPIDYDISLPVGGNNSLSVLELAEQISTRCNYKIKHVEAASYELSGVVNNAEITTLTGWQPSTSIKDMIEEVINYCGGGMIG